MNSPANASAGSPSSVAKLALLMAGPLAIAIGSMIYLAIMITDMSAIPGMSAMMMKPTMFDPLQLFGLFLMWVIMMTAMMLPTATPMIIAYARMQKFDRINGAGWSSVFMFSGGYVAAWAGFSLVAAAMQAGLTEFSSMSPMMMKIAVGPIAGTILIITGIYQLTPLKQSCLRQCQSPLSFLLTQWQKGSVGALRMGVSHGLFCIGCCWALMGLLFVTGVMNTGWIIAITAYVLMEKIIPGAQILSKLVGAVLIALGLSMFI